MSTKKMVNLNADNIDNYFHKVLEKVKEGITIEKAVKSLKIDRSQFYYYLSKENKEKLKYYKACNNSKRFYYTYSKGSFIEQNCIEDLNYFN